VAVTWVIGASGLLGRHTAAIAQQRQHRLQRTPVPWAGGVHDALEALECGIRRMLFDAGEDQWNVVWVAGAGVVGTSPEALEQEREVYIRFLEKLTRVALRTGEPRGSLFYASSAGGVYAGSSGPPFTESTPVHALAAYGREKLAMEEATHEFTESAGTPAMIGRISNLYGPGQNLAKAQGIISQLAKGYLLRTPISLYVSLDTRRDYLYAGDCARMVVRAIEEMPRTGVSSKPTVKILSSGRSTTIAELLGIFQRMFKRRAPLVLGDSPNRMFQVRDLRVRSRVWTELDCLASTPLSVGISGTIADLSSQMRSGELCRT
jgi:UDP-glucose 4-epimerase